ncbi:MAG: hypothetical protein KBS61_09615 [Chryseobacterium sp.]|nr:hypothetical protein [Candidatus Chryseobacterium enterohippi]
MKNRGAAYSELVMESVGRSLYDQNKKAARDAGFRFGSYKTTKQMDMVTDILQSDLDEFIADESGEVKE